MFTQNVQYSNNHKLSALIPPLLYIHICSYLINVNMYTRKIIFTRKSIVVTYSMKGNKLRINR